MNDHDFYRAYLTSLGAPSLKFQVILIGFTEVRSKKESKNGQNMIAIGTFMLPGKTLRLSPIMFCYKLWQERSIKSLWVKFTAFWEDISQALPLHLSTGGSKTEVFMVY